MNVPQETAVRNRIKEFRVVAGDLTQQQLADLVGVTRQTIVAIERRNYAPSLELAFRIAAALKRPLAEVFQYDGQ